MTFLMGHIWWLKVVLDLSWQAAWRSEILNFHSVRNIFKSVFGCSLVRGSFFADDNFLSVRGTCEGSESLWVHQLGRENLTCFPQLKITKKINIIWLLKLNRLKPPEKWDKTRQEYSKNYWPFLMSPKFLLWIFSLLEICLSYAK